MMRRRGVCGISREALGQPHRYKWCRSCNDCNRTENLPQSLFEATDAHFMVGQNLVRFPFVLFEFFGNVGQVLCDLLEQQFHFLLLLEDVSQCDPCRGFLSHETTPSVS